MGSEIRSELRDEVRRYIQECGRPPGLAIVRVGGDGASAMYSRTILRIAEDVSVAARLEQLADLTSPDELRSLLLQLNKDKVTEGIIVQMPLPAHIPQRMVADTIAMEKDIDGISTCSTGNLFLGLPSFLPSTAAAVMEILERSKT